jgi:hypothetical protein
VAGLPHRGRHERHGAERARDLDFGLSDGERTLVGEWDIRRAYRGEVTTRP